jgi:hypothetical protein
MARGTRWTENRSRGSPSSARASNATVRRLPATQPINFRRSVTKSCHRQMEIQDITPQGEPLPAALRFLSPIDEDLGDHLLPVMRVQPLEQLFDMIGNGVGADAHGGGNFAIRRPFRQAKRDFALLWRQSKAA